MPKYPVQPEHILFDTGFYTEFTRLSYFCSQMNTISVSNIPSILISEFDYHLPQERIAVYPLPQRDLSKLLIWHKGKISSTSFAAIDQFIPGHSLLVFNNSRVVHARLLFRRETGAAIELFCLEPNNPSGYFESFSQTELVEWKCLVGNVKKWKSGALTLKIETKDQSVLISAEKLQQTGNAFIIRFTWDGGLTFAQLLEYAGQTPIPPYLNRPAEEVDQHRYQTTYARIDGSVAAPTAGLHFTEEVLKRLESKGCSLTELTLHVGAGTFQPVKTEEVGYHEMHTETIQVTRDLLERLLCSRHTVAVGTTSVRSLESLYWLGLKIENAHTDRDFNVSQWEPYLKATNVPTKTALKTILDWMSRNKKNELTFTSSLIIVPGYTFRCINGMLTNFHQPKSTLLLLIAAFIGQEWKNVYQYALDNNFRFLSYGDTNLYLK